MPEKMPQTFANHSRLDPLFHYFIFPVTVVSVLIAGWNLLQAGVSVFTVWAVISAVALMFAVLKMRTYAMTVQDRLIMLEERLRLATLLPEPLKARMGELSRTQLIALRFASDAEIPALVEKTLSGKSSNADIKKAIVNWRPDYHRV
jgi:hypothetical protein